MPDNPTKDAESVARVERAIQAATAALIDAYYEPDEARDIASIAVHAALRAFDDVADNDGES